jgi:hypothetical protein
VREGVTEDVTKLNATDTITLIEGYDAMRIFLETVSLRLGKTDEEIDFIVGAGNGRMVRRSIRRCGRTG